MSSLTDTKTIKCVGVSYTTKTPGSVEEYDQAAGKQGACLESATMNVIYRSTNAQFRAAFAKGVEEQTGIERATKQIGTKTVTEGEGDDATETEVPVYDYAETEKVYLDRVYEELELETEDQKMTEFGELIGEIEGKLVFDPSGRDPASPKAKKAKKKYREVAEAILAQVGEDGLGSVAEKLGETIDREVEATVDAIALALQYREESKDLTAGLL